MRPDCEPKLDHEMFAEIWARAVTVHDHIGWQGEPRRSLPLFSLLAPRRRSYKDKKITAGIAMPGIEAYYVGVFETGDGCNCVDK
jgi:hypothetical protein